MILRGGEVRPAGEAREIWDVGGRYVSVLGGSNPEFHKASDDETNCDIQMLVKMTKALTRVLVKAASSAQ